MFVYLILLLTAATSLDAYGSGAPQSACQTLAPKHPGGVAQTSPVFYTLEPAALRLAQGDRLTLVVSSPQSSPYQGFMVQARNPLQPDQPLGTFTSIPALTQTVDCPPTSQNSVTHTDKTPKTRLEFEWEPPADYIGTVVFSGTVLQDYSTYWSGIKSRAVQVVKRSLTDNGQSAGISTTRRPKTTPPPTLRPETPFRNAASTNNVVEGCGVGGKTCYGLPANCLNSGTCTSRVIITNTGTKYEFTLYGESFSPNTYIAFGLSTDTVMGADSVVQCVNVNGQAKLYTSWNPAGSQKYNELTRDEPIAELVEGNVTNGNVHCKFTREPKTTHRGLEFDLDKTPYHLMLARGAGATGDQNQGGVTFHEGGKDVTGTAILLSEGGNVGSASKILLRLHAAFMITAWIGAASIGILLARYFKQTWVGNQLCGKDQWFAWHRVCMLLTWTLTIVAFILIFVELKAWSSAANPHAILGTCTTVLAFIQPFMAALRPDPTSSRRPIFNWFHWLVGNAAHILAIVTIFFATRLSKAEVPSWLDWIIVSYVVFHVLMHLTLSIVGCASEKSSGKRVSTFPMKDMGSSRNPLQNPPPRNLDAPHSKLRKILLGIYIVVIILLTVAIIVIVAMAPIEESFQKVTKLLNLPTN